MSPLFMTEALCRQAIESGGCVVLVPGLLPVASNRQAIDRDGVASTRRLSRMLGLSEINEIPDGMRLALESLVASSLLDGESPVRNQTCAAAVTHRADFPQADQQGILRADPAYQQIDMNNATLGNPAELSLTHSECTELQQTLNSHFAEDGIRIEFVDTSRWYCHFDKLPEITTIPISAAIGRDVAECRPTGADARAWRSKLAEIEMLLFEHPVNTARQERGQLPVNTLWLWGEGAIDNLTNASTHNVSVVTDNFYTESFATQCGLESVLQDTVQSVNLKDKACLIATEKFAEISTQQNVEKYQQMLHWFEQTAVSAIWKNLKPDGWSEVVFWCGDNRLFRLQAADKKKFWRRAWFQPQPLTAFINVEEMPPLPQAHQQQGNQQF